MLIHYYLWVFGSVSPRVTKLCMNILVNYGLSMCNSETVIVLNNTTKCAAQKHIFLILVFFSSYKKYSVVSLCPKNQSSISYWFFNIRTCLHVDKLSK